MSGYGRAFQQVARRGFGAERHRRHRVRADVERKDLQHAQRERERPARQSPDHEGCQLSNVVGEVVRQEAPDVDERRPSLLDTGDDRREVVVEEDQVCSLARDVRTRRTHRDPDVRLVERRYVVDPIARHRDDMPPKSQRPGDAELVLRRHARNHGPAAVDECTEFSIVSGQVATDQHGVRWSAQAHLGGDGRRGRRVVAGHHDNRDAGTPAGVQRLPDVGPWRVLQPEHPEQGHARLSLLDRGGRRGAGQGPHGHGDHAQPAGGHRIDLRMGSLIPGTQGQHGVGGALHEHRAVQHHGHPSPPGIEREPGLIDVAPSQRVSVDPDPAREDVQRSLHGVAMRHPRPVDLEHVAVRAAHRRFGQARHGWMAARWLDVQVGIRCVPRLGDGHPSLRQPGLHDRHLVPGQRAGLVGADDRRRAEGLDRLQIPDEDVALRHLLGTPREGQRDGRQQGLGDEGDGDPDGEDEPLRGRVPEQEGDPEERRADAEGDGGDQPDDAPELSGQRRDRLRSGGAEQRQLGEPCPTTGGVDQGQALSLDHERAGEHGLARLDARRIALAGEHGRVQPQCDRPHDRAIRRDAVAGRQREDIPDDDVRRGHLLPAPVPEDGHLRREQRLQPLCRPVGPGLLDEREDGVENDHSDDRDAQLRHACQHGQSGRGPQHEGEEVGQLVQEPAHGRVAPRRRQDVRAVDPKSLGRRCRRQPRRGHLVGTFSVHDLSQGRRLQRR